MSNSPGGGGGDPFLGFIISDVLPASSPTSPGQLSASLILRKVLNKVVEDCGKCHISVKTKITEHARISPDP